jgi:threonine/homoserine/homoserine lactone efflux protein
VLLALGALGLGLSLGIVTGIPLGVINMAVLDAATAGDRRGAIRIGIGGACADMIHAALAFAGTGHVVTQHPAYIRPMAIVAAVLIVGYAAIGRRWRRKLRGHGLVTGFLLTLPNPGALGAWVAMAASVWPTIALPDALVLAAGVGLGSATIFTLLAIGAAKLRRDHPIARWMPRIAFVALLGLAGYGIVRAFAWQT